MFEKMSQGLYKISKVVVIDIKLNSPENVGQNVEKGLKKTLRRTYALD